MGVMDFHNVLHVWTHGTAEEIRSLVVHVVYCLLRGHMSCSLEIGVFCSSCEIT